MCAVYMYNQEFNQFTFILIRLYIFKNEVVGFQLPVLDLVICFRRKLTKKKFVIVIYFFKNEIICPTLSA